MTGEETFTRAEVHKAVEAALAGYTNEIIRTSDMKIEELSRRLAQAEQGRARAWMKGYNLGRHDGALHDRWSISDRPLPTKARRNPYTHDGTTECGCGKHEPCPGFWQGFEAGEESLHERTERLERVKALPPIRIRRKELS